MRKWVLAGAVGLVLSGAALLIPIQGTAHSVPAGRSKVTAGPRAPAPERKLDLLFIHHSIGDQLLAEPGPEGVRGQSPRGGGMRRLLEKAGYEVHTATYHSRLGDQTDVFDWPAKFNAHIAELLTTEDGDAPMADGKRHDVILFKSCYPNNEFVGRGEAPGNPKGPGLTLENAKAAMRSILPTFERHPETLFVFLTTPPLAPRTYPERLGLWLVRAVTGRSTVRRMEKAAPLAREFASWAASEQGWLEGYPLKNVAVIDYYDLLTDHGASNFLAFPSDGGKNSHPTSDGQKRAAPEIVDQLNRAVERAGLGRHAELPHDASRQLARAR